MSRGYFAPFLFRGMGNASRTNEFFFVIQLMILTVYLRFSSKKADRTVRFDAQREKYAIAQCKRSVFVKEL